MTPLGDGLVGHQQWHQVQQSKILGAAVEMDGMNAGHRHRLRGEWLEGSSAEWDLQVLVAATCLSAKGQTAFW